ncbi:MAG TPA: hypothetical protein VGN72_09155 [Tepidisphaeraceae bacterium]|jgi:outer membrane lipoprotein-sorting protein|nr:hypothetical protein [Tepidisphaeraceae bacterium]
MLRTIILACLAFACGCAAPKEDIPTYPLMDSRASLATMRARAEQVQDISGQGTVTLTDPNGGTVQFDAAFVFGPPDRARVRAYKFGQAVLDLTVNPDGLWLFLPRQDARADQVRSASAGTGRAIRQWLQLLAGDKAGGSVQLTGQKLIVTRHEELITRGEIDRPTLTARSYTMSDRDGTQHFSLTLDRYRQVGPTVWPGRIVATSASGKIVIQLRDVELNVAAPTAFEPPPRAERLP